MIATRALAVALLPLLLTGGCRRPESPVAVSTSQTAPNRYANCQKIDGTVVCDPSLHELTIRPELYDGETVVVGGVLDPQREGFALFASEDAYRRYVARSAVLLELAPEIARKDYEPFDGEWVIVRGKYLARGRGSEGKFGGVIANVESVFPIRYSRLRDVPPK